MSEWLMSVNELRVVNEMCEVCKSITSPTNTLCQELATVRRLSFRIRLVSLPSEIELATSKQLLPLSTRPIFTCLI